MFLPKGCGTLNNIHALWGNVWAVIMYFYTNIHALLRCGKSGRQFRPTGPATEVTHLGLNQTPVFSSEIFTDCEMQMELSG